MRRMEVVSCLAYGEGVLVSVATVAGVEQKEKLAKSYGAQAVDMEAAAVAKGAEARGVAFSAVKVISDEVDFELPSMERFISVDGQFQDRQICCVCAAPALALDASDQAVEKQLYRIEGSVQVFGSPVERYNRRIG